MVEEAPRCPMDGAIMDREVFAWAEPPIPHLVATRPVVLEDRLTSWIDTCRRCGWERVVGEEARRARREEAQRRGGTFTLTGPLGTTDPIPYDAPIERVAAEGREVGFTIEATA